VSRRHRDPHWNSGATEPSSGFCLGPATKGFSRETDSDDIAPLSGLVTRRTAPDRFALKLTLAEPVLIVTQPPCEERLDDLAVNEALIGLALDGARVLSNATLPLRIRRQARRVFLYLFRHNEAKIAGAK